MKKTNRWRRALGAQRRLNQRTSRSAPASLAEAAKDGDFSIFDENSFAGTPLAATDQPSGAPSGSDQSPGSEDSAAPTQELRSDEQQLLESELRQSPVAAASDEHPRVAPDQPPSREPSAAVETPANESVGAVAASIPPAAPAVLPTALPVGSVKPSLKDRFRSLLGRKQSQAQNPTRDPSLSLPTGPMTNRRST